MVSLRLNGLGLQLCLFDGPWLESMLRAHGHSSTAVLDALSSLPPLRRGVKLGWKSLLRVGSAPCAPSTRLQELVQLGHCLPQ
jgi:hypothetical protein